MQCVARCHQLSDVSLCVVMLVFNVYIYVSVLGFD